MTDSESDIDDMLPNNIYSFQSGSMKVSAKGPNIMQSFQSTSTTNMPNMPRNFNLNRAYAQSTCDQRSIGYRRETSPMSLYSFSERRPHNYRGTFSGRAGSPTMSIRTMDSNISAIDIAAALKSKNFNKKESRRVAHECSMYLKRYQRARVEKRRQFQKRVMRISGYDSGELASDSSISSDDRRSTKTCRTAYRSNTSRRRTTRTDLADFRRTMLESDMYRDCTNDLRQNLLRNVLPVHPRSVKENTLKRQMLSQSMMSQKNSFPLPSQRYNEPIALLPISEKENRNTSVISQKDRFKNGFLLPSKRFNQSTASLPIPEKEIRRQRPNIDNNMRNVENPNRMQVNHEIDSEEEEIFSETTEMEKTTVNGKKSQCKRSLDPDEHICIPNKRNKLSSPLKKTAASESSVPKQTNSSNDQKKPNDFEFVKPQFPIKKLGKVVTKSQLSQKLSPKPAQKPSEKIMSNSNQQSSEKSVEKSTEKVTSISSQKSREKVTSQPAQKSTEKIILQSVEKSTERVTSKSQKNTEKVTSNKKTIEKLISKPTQHLTETLISKSTQNPTEIVISKSSQPIEALDQPAVNIIPQTKTRQEREQTEETSQFSTTDMSMRPSFIKRKLFTQKVDAESKNSSSDNLTDSSQSNIYSAIQKEKNKTRKLTTQSCLSRDVLGDDSNLLDLIRKIVPKDRMSTTTAVKKTAITNKSKPADTESTCDVIAEMSMYNNDNDDVSDTYTDEEIFKINEASVITNEKTSEKIKTLKQSVNVKKCNVPKMQNDKIPVEGTKKSPEAVNKVIGDNGFEKSKLYKKSFWDTDSESDADFGGISRRISNLYDNSYKGNLIHNNVTTNNRHPRENNKPINRPGPDIPVLSNSKTKALKPVDKDKGNNKKRNQTISQAPQEPKINPPEKVTAKGNLINNNVITNSQHSRKNDKPINRLEPDIPESTNQKTKAIKPVARDTGNDEKRNLTTSQARNVSPQAPKITPPENVKTKGNLTNNNVTTSSQHSRKHDKPINRTGPDIPVLPNPKTKVIKPVEKDTGNNKKRNLTTSQAPNVSPQQPKITPPENVKTKGKENANKISNSKDVKTKNSDTTNQNSNSKNNGITSKSDKTKNMENTDKDPSSNKNNVTSQSANPKKNENIDPVVTLKRIDKPSTKKPNKNTTLNNNNISTKNKALKAKASNNNPLKVKPQAVQSKLDKPSNETNEILNKSLRSRVINLSTSLSEKTNPSNNMSLTKRGRPPKNKNVTKICKEDSSRSDISFTLTEKTSPSKPNKRGSALVKNAQMRSRRSDVSFTLISDLKSLNKTTRVKKNSICHKEVESLQLSSSFFLRSSNKSRTWGKIQCC